jgi:hypothetical protein
MDKKKSENSAFCPVCGTLSDRVQEYKTRQLRHFSVGKMEVKEFPMISFRCVNESCPRKTFSYLLPVDGAEEVVGKSRYTQSSKAYVANKMLKRQMSYNSFFQEIKEDFQGQTSLSSLHRWTQETKVVDVNNKIEEVVVLHTDEKHPSKKKGEAIKNLL